MTTESPTTAQQTIALMIRINRQLSSFLNISESPLKKETQLYEGFQTLHLLAMKTQSYVRVMVKKFGEMQKGYEQHLQKLQDRVRKNAKSHCQMKLYCEYIESQLQNEKKFKKQWQNQLNFLTCQYNKQIETLKTQLSNVMITRVNEQKHIDTGRQLTKPMDTLSKIKLRLLNIGNVQISEPISCSNTIRLTNRQDHQQIKPISQPTSFHNSPVSNTQKAESKKKLLEGKNIKKKETKSKISSRSKSRQSLQKSQQKINPSQSKSKLFKKK